MQCVDLRVLLLAFADKSTQPKALNYISTSCSCGKCLILVTVLNLTLYIYILTSLGVEGISVRSFCKRGHNGLLNILGGHHVVWACEAQIPRGAHRIQEGANAPPTPTPK